MGSHGNRPHCKIHPDDNIGASSSLDLRKEVYISTGTGRVLISY